MAYINASPTSTLQQSLERKEKDDFSGMMTKACEAVRSGNMSQRQAATQFGVPRAMMQKILEGKTCIGAKSGRKPLLGKLEDKLVDYAVDCASLGIGFGKKQFLIMLLSLLPNIR